MMPVIKLSLSRMAASGVSLRRHPRLLRAAGPHPATPVADAYDAACRDTPSDDAILEAEYAEVGASAAGGRSGGDREDQKVRHAEAYDTGFAEGRQQGLDAGREEGLHAGLQQGRQEADSAARLQADALTALGDALTEACNRNQAALEAGAIEIAYAALLRIIGQSAGDLAVVTDTVRRVLEQAPERTLQRIRLSPADHALLTWNEHGLNLGGALLVADERVLTGGCIIDTDAGSLDGRLETQLQELRMLLVELHRANGSQP